MSKRMSATPELGESLAPLTPQQAVIVTGATGFAVGNFEHFQRDLETRMGRPVALGDLAGMGRQVRALYAEDLAAIAPDAPPGRVPKLSLRQAAALTAGTGVNCCDPRDMADYASAWLRRPVEPDAVHSAQVRQAFLPDYAAVLPAPTPRPARPDPVELPGMGMLSRMVGTRQLDPAPSRVPRLGH